MSKSNVQKQLTQWVLKKGAKRSVDVIVDNSELKSKKNCTSDNNSTNVNSVLCFQIHFLIQKNHQQHSQSIMSRQPL